MRLKNRTAASTVALIAALAAAPYARADFQLVGASNATPATYAAPSMTPVFRIVNAAPTPTPVRKKQVWHVTMTPADPVLLRKIAPSASGATGAVIAKNMIDRLKTDGYRATAVVDPAHGTILIHVDPKFAASGPLSQFLPTGDVTGAKINAALPLLSAAAIAHHEHVNLGLDGTTLTPTVTDMSGRSYGGGLIMSSYGPRYAGSDVISAYAYDHVDGYDLSGSVTRGLPGLTPAQSAGGGYLGETVDISHPTVAGVFSFTASHAHYLTGGVLRPLDLTGDFDQFRAGDKYPVLNGHMWLRAGLKYDSDRERLGVLRWTTTQKNLSAYVGADGSFAVPGWKGYQPPTISYRVSAMHGLAGSDSASPGSPNLMGVWANNYTVERLHVAAHEIAGPVALDESFGLQHGSRGTPQIEQAYIGGENRGSSFYTGAFSGPSGLWWSVQASKAVPIAFELDGFRTDLTPFAGINGGSVSPVVGPSESVTSIAVGTRFSVAKHVSGQIGFSHTLRQPVGVNQDNLIDFELVGSF